MKGLLKKMAIVAIRFVFQWYTLCKPNKKINCQ